MATLTCHTSGCVNADVPIVIMGSDVDGNPAPIESAMCGACGEPITDITDNG